MSVIEVEELRRRYGDREALRGISFRVDAGQIVGLLGPNGAGKSTLLKILTGFLAPTGGSARVAGHDVLTEATELQEKIGYLPENAPLYDEMTVSDALTFVGRVRRLGAAERARAIERSAEECGVADRLRQRIGTLSRGYRQRVGLAAALMHQPRLLLLDEPTTGLDPNQIVEIRSLIRRLGATRTVILSSHILPEVQLSCDRVVILHQGRIVADGATEVVTSTTGGRVLTVGIGHGKVATDAAIVQAELAAIPGVVDARAAAPLDERYRFELQCDRDVRADVWQWAVARGHVLVELASHRTNLEELFRRLTEEGT